MTKETIIQAWLDYCNRVLGDEWTVTRAESVTGRDAPRPSGPYVTLKIISGPGKLSLDDETKYSGVDDENEQSFDLVGQRSYTLTIQAFRSGHSDALESLSTSLGDPNEWEKLKSDANISITDRGDVSDISGMLETGFEGRSTIDIFFNSSNNKTIGIGILESVKISGEIENQDGSKNQVDIPDINKE